MEIIRVSLEFEIIVFISLHALKATKGGRICDKKNWMEIQLNAIY